MEPLIFCIDDRLADAGSTLPFAGHLDWPTYTLGDREFDLPQGVDFDVMLTNAGEGILATGLVKAHVVGTCDRCLDPAEFDIASEVDEYYLFEEPEVTADDEDEADYELVSADHTIDLAGAILTALVMDTPYVVLCREDCAGLCPVCGANLNHEDCGHAQMIAEERLKASPFAALKGLGLGEGGSGAEADGAGINDAGAHE